MKDGGSWRVRSHYTLTTALGLALNSMRMHKLRSFLTLLGVIIGVASVVLVGAAIEGLGLYAEESTAKIFGSETFLIAQAATASTVREYYEKLKRNKFILYSDFKYLEATTSDWVLYSPYRSQAEEIKYRGSTFDNASVAGVSAALPEIRNLSLVEGRFFAEEEDRAKRYLAVIGEDIRAALFPASSAVGREIKISGLDFQVIGVLEKLGSSFGRGQDNIVYIPTSAFSRLYGTRQGFLIYGRARPGIALSLAEALDIARMALRVRFRVRPGQPDTFESVTPEGIRGWIDQVLGLISVVVIPVTCISLVVGGIVIMNIMLVSVTERTHEIGIRKSLGARTSDIQLQFLLEAVLMSGIGGAIGVLLGALGTEFLSYIFAISLKLTLPYVALALFVSSAVGVASGWYPARRAARLDPVVALRAE